jgi:hypothetical protein
MATAPEVVKDVSDKPEFRTSDTDISKTSKTKYSIDGIEDGDAVEDVYSRANPARPGFTKNDQKDMYRMGKIQEFRVGNHVHSVWYSH